MNKPHDAVVTAAVDAASRKACLFDHFACIAALDPFGRLSI